MRLPFAVALVALATMAQPKLLTWQPGAWSFDGSRRVAETVLDPGTAWDELIVSWNTADPAGRTLVVRASAEIDGRWTAPYTLAVWGGPDNPDRTSVNDQQDGDGRVATDTLVLAKPATRLRLVLEVRGGELEVDWVAACVTKRGAPNEPTEPNRAAWGQTLKVPRLRQMDFPDGNVICSPTSLSMVLNFWADELDQPRISSEVPETCRWVHDPGYAGTGNWVFNTAYAGLRPGMRGYVSRFQGLAELEDWIAHGWPVVCSVSNAMLKGAPQSDGNDGHLVVLVGFTSEGDPVFNDPGRNETRQTYLRPHFAAAWERSQRTVYLVHPERMRPPKSRFGAWPGEPRPPEPTRSPLPDSWNGTWTGEAVVSRVGNEPLRVQMTLQVSRGSDSFDTEWTTTYAGQEPRRYVLRPVPGKPGEFVMDERNGIEIPTTIDGVRLYSAFQVGDTWLSVVEELDGDTMHISMVTYDVKVEVAESRVGVTGFPFRSAQRAVLRRS